MLVRGVRDHGTQNLKESRSAFAVPSGGGRRGVFTVPSGGRRRGVEILGAEEAGRVRFPSRFVRLLRYPAGGLRGCRTFLPIFTHRLTSDSGSLSLQKATISSS